MFLSFSEGPVPVISERLLIEVLAQLSDHYSPGSRQARLYPQAGRVRAGVSRQPGRRPAAHSMKTTSPRRLRYVCLPLAAGTSNS